MRLVLFSCVCINYIQFRNGYIVIEICYEKDAMASKKGRFCLGLVPILIPEITFMLIMFK